MLELSDITIHTPAGQIVASKTPTIPTPLGPITIEKINRKKKIERDKLPAISEPTEESINWLPIILIGGLSIALVYIIVKRREA